MKRINGKRWISLLLAGAMALQTGAVSVFATEEPLAGANWEEVEIGSDVWETPEIPRAAKSLAGVAQPEIVLNETTGDGTWKFLFEVPDYKTSGIPAPTAEQQDFDFTVWADEQWEDIKVPGEPLMQGFDILNNNEYYYQREITIPEDYAGNRVLVRFDGVYSNARVWIDGKYIRAHVGGFTTWDCDITDYAAPGQTVTMTVGVADIYTNTKGIWNPDGAQVNNPANAAEYAHHNMGGINRDVSLVAMPYNYIAHTYINTDFDANFIDADLEVTAQVGLLSQDATLKVELLDGDAVVTAAEVPFEREQAQLQNLPELLAEANTLIAENADNLYEGETGEIGQYSKAAYNTLVEKRDAALKLIYDSMELSAAKKVTIPVAAPKQWDAEHPNLYTLRTTLLVDGEEVQVNEERFGFREIHYGGRDGTDVNRVYVNGKEVKLRGTCRHDVSYDLGRSITRENAYAEIAAYKKANINHIRTSHYPADENLLDACDEMGIYVEQETAVCFQGPWADVASKYEDFGPQFTEMIERDRNRPSILIWSLGNESNYNKVKSQSGGDAFGDERAYLEDVDRTRPCIFSFPNTGEPANLYDIYSQHYAGVTGGMGSSGKPVLHDEYAHIACYNLDELQRDVNVRNFWGESVKKGWENIFQTAGALGGALWGSVLDAYLREKPEAYLTKKAYSPVRVVEEDCYVANNVLNIAVKNWFDHTNYNELELEYSVDGGEAKRIAVTNDIAPHSNGVVTVEGIDSNAQTVNLKFYTQDGTMVDESNVKLAEIAYSFTPASEAAPAIADEADQIVVSGEGFSVAFSKETGLISEAKFGDQVLITGGPYLNLNGNSMKSWIPAEIDGVTAKIEGNLAVVTLNGAYKNGQGMRFDLKISGNGIITTDYTLTTAPASGSGLKEVGLSYDIPGGVESVSWLRNGLYSAYPEDHIGRNEGTALKVRENADTEPDQYGVLPKWPWKDDMKNYFVYATDDLNNGVMTNDFKTMREHIWYYDVNYSSDENAPCISVEADGSGEAARVAITYDLGYIDDRDSSIVYEGGWGTYNASADYAGTETFSTTLGATAELTFEGTGVRYIGSKQNNVGKVKVYIDGEFKEEIDTYSNLGNELKQSVIYSIEGLENGTHTIKLETSGGKFNCIVVDAFEVLKEGGTTIKEDTQLIINNQWYYPNLGWGNYTGRAGSLANGSKGSSTIRLTNQKNFTVGVIPSVSNVVVAEGENNELSVSYELKNPTEDTAVELQWYRVPVGDPDSKAQAIEGATGATLDASGLSANKVYCTVTLKEGDVSGSTVKSNAVEIGKNLFRYVDIVEDSTLFTFEGEKGEEYKTDADKSWTANAYNKTVTYLMDTKNPASVSFRFTGSGIRWVGAKENNQGIAHVVIDGGDPIPVDLFDANATTGTQVNEVLFEQIWEETGSHTIEIVRTGEKNADSLAANISLDAFIVINKDGAGVAVESVTVEENADGALEAACTIVNGDEEDARYQWYSREAYSADGYAKGTSAPVEGATEKTYIPVPEDAGKLFSCEVTPVAGDETGIPMMSSNEVLVGALMVDDTDEAVQYPDDAAHDTSDMPYLTGTDPYNGTISYFAGGALTFSFNGTGVVWISGYDQYESAAKVVVDGGDEETVTVKGNGKWDFNQYDVYRVTDLEPGDHTITITPGFGTYKYSNIDAFMILNPGEEQPEVVMAELEAALEEAPAEEKPTEEQPEETPVEDGQPAADTEPEDVPEVAAQVLGAYTDEQLEVVIAELTQAIADFKASQITETPSDVDKTALKALIAAVEGKYDENCYTAASWKALTEALNAAKAVVADAAATESQVFDAYLALVAARDGLTYAPDKSLLTLAVEIAEDLLKDESLTAATKEALQAAVNSAKAVLDNADATQAEINTEYEAVMTRITELVKADKTLLRQLIAAADALEEGNYRPSSWANLQAVLTEAKAVEANGNATEAMIAEACSKLTAAINALQSEFNYAAINAALKLAKEILADSKYDEASKTGLAELVAEAEALCESDEVTQKDLDDMAKNLTRAVAKVRLAQAVAEVNGLNAARYTAASWNAVQAAQAEAKALLANENATAEELTGAATKLANAVKSLVKKSGSSGSVSKVSDNDYWNEIIEKINGTEKGGTVKATLESGAMTPATVIDAAAAKGVKLNVEIGGKAYLLSNYAIDASAVYYSAAELIAMADGKAPAAGDAAGSGNANPETGGEVAATVPNAAAPAGEANSASETIGGAQQAAAEQGENLSGLWLLVLAAAAIGGAATLVIRRNAKSK
ncbi:FIVAR domain-containing protein [Clostridiaceae bacterium NSJ-31]|uniref:beta-galactosidase n=1 Tax=Ligaoa zhengdingensis TaxID=2763658 RepID=A0A926I102_9FIRM|nr:glycoside hydrolase family 2 TIM barrel-domain containing protein [Ligaoa zhengdingensis]MBC8547562.1 FIVAR domain-containing protein [Ligaoa zhengdingensis]